MSQIAEIRMIDDAVWGRIPVSGDDGRVQLLTDAEITANDQKVARLLDENDRLQEAKRAALKVADERSKENCALRQLLRDARDHVPWDVLKRIDEALGASRAEQKGNDDA